MFSRALRRIWRSATVRFALIATVAFSVLVIAGGYVAGSLFLSTMERQAMMRAEAAAAELVEEANREGFAGLVDAVRDRIEMGGRRLRFSVLETDGSAALGDPEVKAALGLPQDTTDDARPAPSRSAIAQRSTNQGHTVVVMDDFAGIDEIREILHRTLGYLIGAVALAGAALGLGLSRYVAAELASVNRTAEAIIAGDTSRRVPLAGSGDDFDRLRATLNLMLETISDLLEQVHQISTDIAHDLRTPLGNLRNRLERTFAAAGSNEQVQASIARSIRDLDLVLATFAALLRIAQIEAGRGRSQFAEVDLTEAVESVVETYLPVAENAGYRLVSRIEPGIAVSGDRELLVQLLINLVENALRHTDPGTEIIVGLEHGEPGPVLSVADNGPGIAAAESSLVFRRFYRSERSRTTPGDGLGLSIVAAVAKQHAADLALADESPGTRITVGFPDAAETRPQSDDAWRVPSVIGATIAPAAADSSG